MAACAASVEQGVGVSGHGLEPGKLQLVPWLQCASLQKPTRVLEPL
jgi:hypothetical protein